MAAKDVKLNSGYSMPLVGLGTWNVSNSDVTSAVQCAINAGYKHIDCAHLYQNEVGVGDALRECMANGKIKREDLFVTAKLWNYDHRPDRVGPALDKSLKALQLDYVDLFLIHSPVAYIYITDDDLISADRNGNAQFEDTDYVATWKAMEELLKTNKVKSIGVSNFNKFQLERVIQEGSIVPAVNQIEVHPFLTQKDLIEFCRSKGIVVTSYSQFGSPARPWADENEPKLLDNSVVTKMAKRLDVTPAQVLLRYHTQRNIVVIPKSVTPSRIKCNLDCFGFDLSENYFKLLDALHTGWRALPWSYDVTSKYYPFKPDYQE